MPSLFNEYKSRKLVGVIFMVHCARNKSKSLNKKPYFRNGITCEINHGAEMKLRVYNMVLGFGDYRGQALEVRVLDTAYRRCVNAPHDEAQLSAI